MTTREYLFEKSEVQPAQSEGPKKPDNNIWKILLYSFLGFLGFIVFTAFSLYTLFFVIPKGPEIALVRGLRNDTTVNEREIPVDKVKVLKDLAVLEKKVDKLTTQGPYLIVNTTENKFYLYDGKELVRQGRCSTGKNIHLIDEKRKQDFYFKTPRGVHKVRGKQKDPVWTRPNWAYIEEGLPIPSAHDESRFDESTLGPYKLDIGDGYMVHGTIWKRRMGLPVTHGCVRLLDEDLEAVYNLLTTGSKVIIY